MVSTNATNDGELGKRVIYVWIKIPHEPFRLARKRFTYARHI